MAAMVGSGSLTRGNAGDNKELLLGHVKKEVKQIMEEAVTRKFIHEDSSSVLTLCGAVEACVRHRLKRQVLGLFKSKDGGTSSLLHKVAKSFAPAAEVSKLTKEAEQSIEAAAKANSAIAVDDNRNHLPKGTAIQRHVWIRVALFQKVLAQVIDYIVQNSSKYYEKDALMSDPCEGPLLASLLEGPCALEFTKMKTADHLWSDPHADELVLRHRIQGGGSGSGIGGSMVGGSASSICINASSACAAAAPGALPHRRLTLGAKTSKSSSSSDESGGLPSARTPPSAKDYVESLHQNGKATLLYGKNNVLVQPTHDGELLPGYLALHQSAEGVTLSWTPNQLMRGGSVDTGAAAVDMEFDDGDRSPFLLRALESPKSQPYQRYLKPKDVLYWDYAMRINLDDVVYLHCHQQRGQEQHGGTLVMVGQDGVQRPPIHFPRGSTGGSHLLAFLTCLEAGLQPRGQLDPPLWSQEDKGKVFPKVKRKWSHSFVDSCLNGAKSPRAPVQDSGISSTAVTSSAKEEEENANGEIDYVFRIVRSFNSQELDREILMDVKPPDSSLFSFDTLRIARLSLPWAPATGAQRSRSVDVANSADVERSIGRTQHPADRLNVVPSEAAQRTPGPRAAERRPVGLIADAASKMEGGRISLRQLCQTMARQIISRAFYGWLAHCRHLRTVRTHLAGLVFGRPVFPIPEQTDKDRMLTAEYWHSLSPTDKVTHVQDIYRKVYYGGISHEIRKEVWPYLLGHYRFGWNEQQKAAADAEVRANYELIMSRWLAVESVVKLREQERHELKTTEVAAAAAAAASTATETTGVSAVTLSSASPSSPLRRSAPGSVDSIDGLAALSAKQRLCRKVSSLSNEVFLECDGEEHRGGDSVMENYDRGSGVFERQEVNGSSTKAASTCGSDASSAGSLLPGTRRLIKSQRLQSTEEVEEGESAEDDESGSSDGSSSSRSCSSSSSSDDGDRGKNEDVNTAARRRRQQRRLCKATQPANPNDTAPPNDITSASPDREAGTSVPAVSVAACTPDSHVVFVPASPADGEPTGDEEYSVKFLDDVALNWHRVDKDVHRCDRNYWYFNVENLKKLRNVVCTYVWQNLDVGYVQGMCDLAAPLLVVLDDESLTYSCFCALMRRMADNFPLGSAMDRHLSNMRSLAQVLDPELFEHMQHTGDFTHFYFSYRWLLLDLKRELVYDDVFLTWETIWVAKHVCSSNFVLFIALALVECYRDIILENAMDFTDVIKFFNEMAEKHSAKRILRIARELVYRLQQLVENKAE